MKASIDIIIENNKLTIWESRCEMQQYEISEDLPSMIDEVCEHLHDYLEGLG